jgi:hypothetical protein
MFGLEMAPLPKVPEYNFKFKEKVHLENTPVFKSADPETFMGLITGDYYVHDTRPVRGMIKLAASESDCDIRLDVLWYAKIKDIVNVKSKRRV